MEVDARKHDTPEVLPWIPPGKKDTFIFKRIKRGIILYVRYNDKCQFRCYVDILQKNFIYFKLSKVLFCFQPTFFSPKSSFFMET